MEMVAIPALRDNYIWCLHDNKQCIIVDPGDAVPVLRILEEQGLTLRAVLITHHHYDHTNGITELLNHRQVPIYGPSDFMQTTIAVSNLKSITIAVPEISFDILRVPGHTIDHIAYYSQGIVFTGDTLFTAGCGRIFEGTALQMYTSLQTLQQLPDNTLVYCGHEYTENNLKFALEVEPNNFKIKERLLKTQALRRKNQPTVPATLANEKATNPFLRTAEKEVIAAASKYCGQALTDPIKVLSVIRAWKNTSRS